VSGILSTNSFLCIDAAVLPLIVNCT